jgi:integrase
MQRGCLERINRKRGPDVWQFRWSETSSGTRLYRKKVIGTVEQYPDEDAARRKWSASFRKSIAVAGQSMSGE